MHIAIKMARTFHKVDRSKELNGATYDHARGYWLNGKGDPLVRDPDGPKPTSKKDDIETGEDKKGE